MKKFVVMFSAIMLMAVPALSIAAPMAGSNTVNSAAIIDGSVATADIANKAVTAAKIANATITATQLADGAVTNAKIAAGAVTADKLGIVCPSGQYLQYNGTTWACNVGTAGPQGIQGVQGPVGPQGPAAKYANVIVVAKSGGDFTSVRSAVDSIENSSETNRYLIKIMPGVYDESQGGNPGTNYAIQPKSFVTIQGSGIDATKVIMHRATNTETSPYGGIIVYDLRFINNITISDMTVEASIDSCIYDGYGATMSPIQISYSDHIHLSNLKLIAKGSETNIGLQIDRTLNTEARNIEIVADTSSCTAYPSTYSVGVFTAQGGAMDPYLRIYNSKISATGAKSANEGLTIYGDGQNILIYNTEVSGAFKAIGNFFNPNFPGKVISVGSKITGELNVAPTSRFFNCFDQNYNVINFP